MAKGRNYMSTRCVRCKPITVSEMPADELKDVMRTALELANASIINSENNNKAARQQTWILGLLTVAAIIAAPTIVAML